MIERRKVFFELEQDDSGYPPVGAESLWAIPTAIPEEYVLDNIPFFEKVATIGDTIRVEEHDGRLWHRATVKRTQHSLVRVVGLDGNDPAVIGRELGQIGCTWELDRPHELVAIDIPPHALGAAQRLLAERAETGTIDYEEPILRTT